MDGRHPVRYVDHRVGERPLQRTAAVASLVLGLAGLVLLVWSTIDNIGYFLIVIAAAALLLVAGFSALTSTGGMRLVSAIATVVAGLVVVVATIVRISTLGYFRWSSVVGAALVLGSVAAGRYALRVPPPSGDAVWAEAAGGRTSQHPVVVANPHSGGGKVVSCDLVAVAAEHGIEVVLMERGDDPGQLARAAVAAGADALGMAGGDGSLAAVAQVAAEHDLPFVVVPAGTRNHYAGDLGLDRTDPTQALAAFVRGEEHAVDYSTVNDRMFLNNVSLGLYAAAVEQPGYRDAKVETTLKVLPDLLEKGGASFDLQLEVPGQGHWDSAALIQVSNGAYEMSGPAFGRRLHLDAGQLGVIAVDVNHGADLAAITMLAAARQVERHSGVWPWVTTELTIGSGQEKLPVGIDGEHVVLTPPLVFRVVPRGLRVLVPEGTAVGLANQHLGAQGTVSGLLEVAFNLGSGGDDA
ncbi:MAG TPA: diacylglycerol kinase family protein [Acidimicrobiales bacterium]